MQPAASSDMSARNPLAVVASELARRDGGPGSHPARRGGTRPAAMAGPPRTPTLWVEPWGEEVDSPRGHHPTSPYVEYCWLGVLGPSSTWLVRRLALRLEESPKGFALDARDIARELGMGSRQALQNAFDRSFDRCVRFGLMQRGRHNTLFVHTRFPNLTPRMIERLPPNLREAEVRLRIRSYVGKRAEGSAGGRHIGLDDRSDDGSGNRSDRSGNASSSASGRRDDYGDRSSNPSSRGSGDGRVDGRVDRSGNPSSDRGGHGDRSGNASGRRDDHGSGRRQGERLEADVIRRARHVAMALLACGDESQQVVQQLQDWQFHPATAFEAARWATERHNRARATVRNRTTAPRRR